MQGFQLVPDHILIGQNKQSDKISLEDGYIVAISIENFVTSPDQLQYGLNEAANKVPLDAGDKARDYRALELCGVPCYYKGELNWAFATNNVANKGLVIITRIVPIAREVPETE